MPCAPPRAPPPQPAVTCPPPLHSACMHAALTRCLPPTGSRLPAHSPPRSREPCACDPRQYAYKFNQPLSWDISRVTNTGYMFYVRCSARPAPPCSAQPLPLPCTLRAPRSRPYTPAGGGSRVAPPTPHALLATRQDARSLSAANKLLIRCAWAGNPAFVSLIAGYGPGGRWRWPSGSCA